MARARVSELELTGSISAAKRARISQLSLTGAVGATTPYRARISRLGITGSTSENRARISQLRLVGSVSTALSPVFFTPTPLAEPGQTVTVSTSGTTGSQVVVSFSTPAPDVVLTGSGVERSFVAPRSYTTRVIAVQATFSDQYGATAVRTLSIQVAPHQFWFCRPDGQFIPVRTPFRRI